MIRTLFREANKPEPIEKIDKSGWVKWGEDNLYPQFLVNLAYDNPIHGGIINQKVTFITAGGVIIEGDEQNVLFTSGETLQSVVESAVRDFEIGETYSILFKKSLSTGKWSAQNIDFELIRATENLLYYDYSDDWGKTRQGKETNYRKIKSIHYVTAEDNECIFTNVTRPKQRYHGKDKKKELTSNYYPVPNYSGAITSILAGIEQDYFTYSEVVNSYKGGTLINLANGVPETVQEEDKIIKRIKGEASNKETQGGLTVTFSDGQDSAPTVQQINGNDLDKRYIESNKEIVKKIMMAHAVISAELFGLVSDSLFGSKEQLEISYKLFQENYVKKRQTVVADSLTWCFKRLNGFAGKIIFNDYVLNLEKNVSTDNAVSNAINGMSPLVANKLLNVLTTNEIRALARLQPIDGGDVVPTVATPAVMEKMSEEIDVVSLFENVGGSKEDFKILASRPYETFDDNEEVFKSEFVLGKFAFELLDVDRQILNMISNGESYQSINQAIGKGGQYLSSRLFELTDNGYLTDWKVTEKGQKASVPATELEVRYSYELRPNAPDLVAGGSSRPFCERMVGLNRMYTRDEINQISSAIGRDVWTFRGGWYHNPETDVNTPSCRHLWQQHITVKTK